MIDSKDELNINFSPKVFFLRLFTLSSISISIVILIFLYFITAPFVKFNTPVMIEVDSGDSVKLIANKIESNHIIRSSQLLRLMISIYGGQNKIKAGVYEFDSPSNVFNIAHRLVSEDYGYVPVKITFPEGINSRDVLSIIYSKFPNIKDSLDTDNSPLLITSKEGYLFPDTYFFPPNADLNMIVDRMYSEYKKKIKKYESQILGSGKSESEVIIMASILEKEVQTAEDKKIVSDLLQRRIDKSMPLQVDSTLTYIMDKKSSELTMSDLATTSPFNTYKSKGLPPLPISNPGLESIDAVLNPIKNDYIFFLTGDDGRTYYSKTYAEHLRFKKKYIR